MTDPVEQILTGENFRGLLGEISNNPRAIQFLTGMRKEMEKLPEAYLKKMEEMKTEIRDELKTDYDAKISQVMSIVLHLSKEMKEQKRLRIAMECKTMETTLFVNGVPFDQKAIQEKRYESDDEVFEKLKEVFKSLECTLEDRVSELKRLPPKTKTDAQGKEYMTNTCKLSFVSVEDKINFFKCLKENGKKIPNLRVKECLPKDLLPMKNNLERIAHKWRKDEEGLRTRVQVRNGELQLMIKKPDESKFTRAASNKINSELSWLKEQKVEDNSKNKRPRPEEEEEDEDNLNQINQIETIAEIHNTDFTYAKKPSYRAQASKRGRGLGHPPGVRHSPRNFQRY